ncbi:MAG: methionyl-tRNA formyltransferase [Ekhidna sp.]|nr:methionyl-tRNA formyltransferase [Ekhidna sp.]MBC6427009.1 methionyl-tRNA formyltransferase [Ekhidna sp.]
MIKGLRVIFLGTPDFAMASLRKLVENGIHVVAVITAPDRPKGRGKKPGSSAVKDYALKAGFPILQPTNLKSAIFLEKLKRYQADLQIVVAFRMLPEAVWNMPPLGTFNLHASLLPQYRGAAPINRAIINGEKETGITTFFLNHEIDTGKIIFQEREAILPEDTAGTLYARLMEKGANLVLKTVHAIQENNYPQRPQKTEGTLKNAPKIFKEGCKVNWDQESKNIINFIRGLSPYPGAWSVINGKTIKIFCAEEVPLKLTSDIGKIKIQEDFLLVKTRDTVLKITDMQLEGRRRMKTEDFLRGYTTN